MTDIVKEITEIANEIIDKKGYFIHVQEWETKIILEAYEVYKEKD